MVLTCCMDSMVHLGTQLQSKLLHKTEGQRIRIHFTAEWDVAFLVVQKKMFIISSYAFPWKCEINFPRVIEQLYVNTGYFPIHHDHRCTLCKASKTSLQLNGHHKSKQKCDLLCSVLHATEKWRHVYRSVKGLDINEHLWAWQRRGTLKVSKVFVVTWTTKYPNTFTL